MQQPQHGLAIASTHYVAIAAMQLHPAPTYNYALVATSVFVAVLASWAALWIASRTQAGSPPERIRRLAAGLILGLAIAGTHYIGIGAATFPSRVTLQASNGIDTGWLAMIMTSSVLILLVGTLIVSRMDSGYDSLSDRMVASLEDAHQQLILMATQDPLTGLPNRGSLLQRMQEMIVRSNESCRPFTVMFSDLDGFKTINDSLGHAAGDKLLIEFSELLKRSVRRRDMVGRIGGDEFILLLEDMPHPDGVLHLVHGILQRLQQDFVVAGTTLRMTTSIGLASYPEDGSDAEELLRHADLAMYDAKQRGKNRFRFYDLELSSAALRSQFIYRALADAFDKNQMSLHYQPKFGGATRNLVGAEALIRWNHPEMGEITPRQFIPIAERTGQIVDLGNWVIQEVCRHIRQWDREGLPPVKIAINLSPEQLMFPRYLDTVLTLIHGAGVAPSRIMFEITETAAMRNAEQSAQVLSQFTRAGFDFSIDDFGTGYSSLAYLQQFSVKQLKIDQFFTQGMDIGSTGGMAIVTAIIAMAHSLDMIVVAEGVETESQLAKLQSLHCDELQGYLLARPLTADAFRAFMRGTRHGPVAVPDQPVAPRLDLTTRPVIGAPPRALPLPQRGRPEIVAADPLGRIS